MKRRNIGQGGFTILELMIASSIFAVVLLVIAAGILRFSHDYYKGINTANTQAVARGVMSDIIQNIQFGGSAPEPVSNNGIKGYCIGNTFYTFNYDTPKMVSATQSGLVKTDGASCSAATPTVPAPNALDKATQRDMLSEHMRLTRLDIEPTGSTDSSGLPNTWNVSLKINYGDADLYVNGSGVTLNESSPVSDWATAVCSSKQTTQFCASSQLTTTVTKRL
jgi:prepilin-type N-terminal cleavage/methylation domain-containing protein